MGERTVSRTETTEFWTNEFSFDTPEGPAATGYVLTVDGPKPSSRYISAGSADAAILLAKASTWTEYGDETDPEVLASRVSLKAGESVTFEGTVGQVLKRSP